MKLLITGGATQEPIDQVRFITNFSTGATSAEVARVFASIGHDVTLLHGIGAVSTNGSLGIQSVEFTDFKDLDSKLRRQLSTGKYDAVIHASAVSDFSVAAVEFGGSSHLPETLGKIDSGVGEVVLRLKRNFKILDRLKSYSPDRRLQVVGFKLTHTPRESERLSAIRAVASSGNVDFVVHNDYGDIRKGQRKFALYRVSEGAISLAAEASSREDLARELAKVLQTAESRFDS